MSNNVYPSNLPGLGYSVMKAPEASVIIQSSPSFSELRILQTQNPIWHFELLYDFIRDNPLRMVGPTYTDLQVMMGFFLQQGMSYDSFLFTDPDDKTVNNFAQQIVTDGTVYYTPLQRSMGGLFLEDITDLNPLDGSAMTVTANNVTKTLGVDFTVNGPGLAVAGNSFSGMYLTWRTAGPTPNPVPPVKTTFNFYFRVRFENAKQAFEKWANTWWSAGGETSSKSDSIKLVTARPPGG